MTDRLPILVVVVPHLDVEIVADLLWQAGAQAVEEVDRGDRRELRTELGDDPMTNWAKALERMFGTVDARSEGWIASVIFIDRAVTDTWRDYVVPIDLESIRVVPAWTTTTREQNDVLIDPGAAFGMGDHPTTRATLRLALTRSERGETCSSVLDLGCGSGVLGIAMALRNSARIVAIDIAPAAVEATRSNAELNGVGERFVIEQGDVYTVTGTYELVLANILAPVLLTDCSKIAASVATGGGAVILSGFTESRRHDIQHAYESQGLHLVNSLEVDGWFALEMQRP